MKGLLVAFGFLLLVTYIEGCDELQVDYAYIRSTSKPYNGRYSPGAKLYFECHDGYMMKGHSMIECDYSYRWKYDAPMCNKKQVYCVNPRTFFGGDFHPDKPEYNYLDKVYYSCPGRHSKYIYSTCGSEGRWKQSKMCYDYCMMPEINHGYYEPKMKKYTQGHKVMYHCNEGYYKYYIGKEFDKAMCGEDGMWDMKAPICKKYCKVPDYRMYKHRPYTKSMYKIGEKIMYHCMDGYSEPSDNKYRYSTCMDGEMWDKKPYKCEMSCVAPESSDYYHVPYAKSMYKPYEKIMYKCMQSYYKSSEFDHETATCQPNGKWDYEPYECKQYCKPPKMIKHGGYTPEKQTYKHLEKMYYECRDGYEMYYKDTKYEYNICGKHGKWEHVEPMCKKYCMPPKLKYLQYKPKMEKYNAGDRLMYKCDDGYKLMFGKDWFEYNTCKDNGYWMFDPPMCQKVHSEMCETPKIIHGSYMPMKKAYKYMDKITYKCHEGYKMYTGDKKIETYTCIEKGKWDHPTPMCRPHDTHYCKPPMIMHGSFMPMKEMYMTDDRIYFSCMKGYGIFFDVDWFEYAKCQKDGNWDFKPPKCIDMSKGYCDPPEFMHGMYKPKMKKYEEGDRLYYECNSEYQIYYGDDWFDYSTCMSDGSWDFQPPMCRKVYSDTRKFCYPPEFMHGMLRPSKSMYEVDEKLYYDCKREYMKYYDGDRYEYSVCKPDGTWDKMTPMCKSKYEDYCQPPTVMHGSFMPIMKMYNAGDRLRYKCDYGYDMYYKDEGYYYATCMKEGNWDKKPPMCKHSQTMYCKKSVLDHGLYKPMREMYSPGDRVYFSCKPGYELHYEEEQYDCRICMDDGHWNNMMPTCKMAAKRHCDSPTIEHGLYMPMKNKYSVGDKVSYKCKMDYNLFFENDWFEFTTCKAGGYWDFNPPMCKEKKMKFCSPPDLHYVYYTPPLRTYKEGARMYYKCHKGYKIHYKDDQTYEYNTCMDGMWKYEAPMCVEMKKKYCKPPINMHGKYMPKMEMYMAGDRVWHHCKEGYMMQDDYDMEYTTCMENGMWNMKPPMCKKRGMNYCIPPKMKHGSHSQKKIQYSRGDRVSYKCDDGYEMKYHHGKPYQFSTCKSDGNWDNMAPMCMDKTKKYCMVPDVMHSEYLPTKKYYNDGDRIYFQCKYGYYIYYSGYYSRHSTCKTNGKWDVLPMCKEMQKKYCRAPDYKNYYHKPYAKKMYMAGEWMRYECDHSYYASSKMMKNHALCKNDGTWDYPPMKCMKYCMVDEMKYRYYTPMKKYYMPGDKITYSCKDGFYMSDYRYSHTMCKPDGKWDKKGPMCKKSCYAPYLFTNGVIYGTKYAYNYGERITFTCNRGYRLSAFKNYVDCGHYGKWNSKFPTCYRN